MSMQNRQTLAIHKQVLGPGHPNTAFVLNNLAELYRNLGQYEDVLPLYQRALAISEQVLGQEHPPHTAQSLNNLAAFYDSLGQPEQALSLYQRVPNYFSCHVPRRPVSPFSG